MSGDRSLATLADGAARGVVGAMAMTGLRQVAAGLALVGQTPPEAILKKKARGLLAFVPPKRRKVVYGLAHWGFGAVGGAGFAALPESVRRRAPAGPLYGLGLWLLFEVGMAPALGLPHAKRRRLVERGAFAVDHVLYGLILSAGSPPRRDET